MSTYSAALLAGGHSTRMGRDKALLPLPDSHLLLWQRQLRVLEDLQPEEIFWSGPVRLGLPRHLHVVRDAIKEAGPLAGVSACLNRLRNDLLVVLAIDLPQMNAAFLQGLLAQCSSECGVVAAREGFFEPLAAIYPKRIRTLAAEHLRAGRFAMHDFIREALKEGALQALSIESRDFPLFKNLNEPQDGF